MILTFSGYKPNAMKKYYSTSLKMSGFIVLFLFALNSSGQTTISSEKDITRPEINRQFENTAAISTFSVVRNNGYNEINWTAIGENQTRKFIVEYSTNCIYYQAAGEMIVSNGQYHLNHTTNEIVPLLYRIKGETLNGRAFYSPNFLLAGIESSPVKVYPTVIVGNTMNVRAAFPVQRITVLSTSGQQVFVKDVNGNAEDMSLVLPSLGRGMYYVHFTGRDWKATEKIIVQ